MTMRLNRFLVLASMVFLSTGLHAASPGPVHLSKTPYSRDFVAGFKKGSNDARAYYEGSAQELDATYNFSKYAVAGQLPPALRSVNPNAPVVYRCGKTGSADERFTVIAPARALCKATDVKGACTASLSWRDFLLEDLAPASEENAMPMASTVEFKRGEEAAKNTALDNMRMLSETYVGMGTYRALENCKAASSK